MKKTSLRLLALLAVVFCCLPMLFTSLADDTAKGGEIDLEKAYEELYVSDVDGDGNSDLAFFYDAFTKTASDKVGTSVTDRLGNKLTVASGASYGEKYLNLAAQKLDMTAFYSKKDDFYFDLLLVQGGTRPSTGGRMVMGPAGSIQIQTRNEFNEDGGRKKNNSPIDESYGVISGTYWDYGDKWGTDVDWAKARFLGAYVGEIYSIGVAVDKTIADESSTYTMTYYREGARVRDTSKSHEYKASADTELFFGHNFDARYYAVRLYTKILTEEQMAQNAFADLLNYYRPANFADYVALSDAGKAHVKELCASLKIGASGTESTLIAAITEACEAEMGGAYMTFEGYSMRMAGAREMRITYTLNKAAVEGLIAEGKLVEMGAIYTPLDSAYGNEQMKKQDLTLEYAARKSFAEQEVFYKVGDKLSDLYFAIFDCGSDAKDYGREHMVRGYLKIKQGGKTVIIYENANSERFGDTVSLVRLAAALYGENEYKIPDLAPEAVLEAIVARGEGVIDSYEKSLAEATKKRVDTIDGIANAKAAANQMKEELKEISREGIGADAATQTALKAEASALTAKIASLKADAQKAHPNLTESMLAISADSETLSQLLPLAYEALSLKDGFSERFAALSEAAAKEAEAQSEGFAEKTLCEREDALDALEVAKKLGTRIQKGEFHEVKTLKILSIGNSWSVNALSQLYQIAEAHGYEDIVFGILYKSGCSIALHATYLKEGTIYESYRKNTDGTFRIYDDFKFTDGLQDEAWDIITFQQSSTYSANLSSLQNGDLDDLIDYVNKNKLNKDAKLYYHATWSFAEGHAHSKVDAAGYEYMKDQAEMDRLIAECVEKDILTRDDFENVIYAGVSIAEARKYFGSGFELYKSVIDKTTGKQTDGYHLNAKGCYIVGLTWFATLTGEDISDTPDVNHSFASDAELQAAIAAAKVGIAKAK